MGSFHLPQLRAEQGGRGGHQGLQGLYKGNVGIMRGYNGKENGSYSLRKLWG